MLRLNELKLPLDHAPDALRPAIVQRLGIADADLLDYTIFRRGYDARKKSAILLVYSIDLTLRDEAAVRAMYESADPIHVFATDKALFGELAAKPEFEALLREQVAEVRKLVG